MTTDALDARFAAFVEKVTSRWQAVRTESDAGFAGLLADPGLDPIAFLNAMNAIEQRKKDLVGLLETTYAEQVVAAAGGRHAAAEARMKDAEDWIEEGFERFRVGWHGQLVRQLWGRVGPLMQRPVACTSCGATLTNRTVFHQAESVPCPHCRAVNSVTPDTLVYHYFAIAPDRIGDEAALEAKIALDRAERRGGAGADRRALHRAYWEAWVRGRASVVPMDEAEQRRYVDARLAYLDRWR